MDVSSAQRSALHTHTLNCIGEGSRSLSRRRRWVTWVTLINLRLPGRTGTDQQHSSKREKEMACLLRRRNRKGKKKRDLDLGWRAVGGLLSVVARIPWTPPASACRDSCRQAITWRIGSALGSSAALVAPGAPRGALLGGLIRPLPLKEMPCAH